MKTIESWALDIMLVAAMRQDADDYIRRQAKKAKQTWAKRADLVTRQSLNLIIRCSKPQDLINEAYEQMKEE